MIKIPLVDLKAQNLNLKSELVDVFTSIISESTFIGGHPVSDFEHQFANFCGVENAIGTSNGTDAIFIALWALGVGPGDEVIIPAHTFIATSEAVRLLGAVPVFVDIEEYSFNINPEHVVAAISSRTRAIVAVHLYGRPAPMERLESLASLHRIALVGDGAQVHGAYIGQRHIAEFGDATAFSFYPGKNLGACGDAGAIVTTNSDLAQKMRMLVNHGRSNSKYLHQSPGMNARLDSLQAAILSVKLKYLRNWCKARQNNAYIYSKGLANVPQVRTPELLSGEYQHSMHLYVIRVPTVDRPLLLEHLKNLGIEAGIHYPIPLHLQPCNADLGYKKGSFPISEMIADQIISLPMYPELSGSEIEYVVDGVKSYFSSR